MGALLTPKKNFKEKNSIAKTDAKKVQHKAATKNKKFNFRTITAKEQEQERINVYSYII